MLGGELWEAAKIEKHCFNSWATNIQFPISLLYKFVQELWILVKKKYINFWLIKDFAIKFQAIAILRSLNDICNISSPFIIN